MTAHESERGDKRMSALPRPCRGLKPATAGAILVAGPNQLRFLTLGVACWQKYMFLFNLTGEAIKGFVAKPSDREAAARELVESLGGSFESYHWMFGQYDGALVAVLPDSQAAAT